MLRTRLLCLGKRNGIFFQFGGSGIPRFELGYLLGVRG